MIPLTYEQEQRALREQVTNLQAQLTELELRNRVYRHLCYHFRDLLQFILIEHPIATRLHVINGRELIDTDEAKDFLKSVDEVQKRVAILEEDAGTQTTWLVRQMIERAKSLPFKIDSYGEFVWQHVNQFKQILGIEDAKK